MKELKWHAVDEATALERGQQLGQLVQGGQVIRLEGDLGAGKTTFTRGIARGLGIQRAIKSPSYTLVREYQQGRIPLYHIDLYRLEDGGVEDLALDEYYEGSGLTVVEWGSVSNDHMPDQCLLITFKREDQEDRRQMVLQAYGPAYEDLLEDWQDSLV